ncbi:MAG: flagellar biosynthetic protein FliQ [Pseudomonadota bacterium]
MAPSEVLDMLRSAMMLGLMVSWPVLTVALVSGLGIGLLQALTSIQELTLTFVPKLAAMLLTLWVGMSIMGQLLVNYYQDQVIPIIAGG